MERHIDPGAIDDMLDPHRREEIARAGIEIAGRLHQKGITDVTGEEDAGQLSDLLSAAERFEAAVINRGGDPMVNMPDTNQPQDPGFVLPVRRADDSLETYSRRINEAAEILETPRKVF